MSDKKPTYGKLPSQGFMNRNPRYRVAEHKLEGPREKKPEPGRPLDVHKLLNAGYSRDEAEYAASDARERGMRTAFGKTDLEPDRNLSPRERRRMGLDGNSGGTRTPIGPTDDQRKWARNFRESQSRPPLRSAAGPQKPLNFSRSAMVEGAKRSGDFSRVRGDYNRQSAAAQTGMRMNDRGSITPLNRTTAGADGMTPYAREKFGPAVEDNRARRDFARGEAMNRSVSQGVEKMTKTNPYGSASATYGGKPTGPGMMPDPLTGKQVPMRQWASDQSAVQATKEGTSGWGENRTTNKAGDDYFNPQKIRQDAQQSKGGAKTPAASGKTRTSSYDNLSPAMTGDTGTIKSPLPEPRGGISPQYSGISTDSPGIRNSISAMSGSQTGMDTIKSPLPERSGPLNIPKARENFSGGGGSARASSARPAQRSGGGRRK
jgi:hypothetical protein